MTNVIREGDSTTTGGTVLSASGIHTWEDRRVARMGDPVWCPGCGQVGFIAQGNPTFIDQLVAVATEGHAVRCGCPEQTNLLIASQDQLQADMEAMIVIPHDMAETAGRRASQLSALMGQQDPL